MHAPRYSQPAPFPALTMTTTQQEKVVQACKGQRRRHVINGIWSLKVVQHSHGDRRWHQAVPSLAALASPIIRGSQGRTPWSDSCRAGLHSTQHMGCHRE